MRKICLLLATVFLLQSCFSYKSVTVDPKAMSLGEVYKIEHNGKTFKGLYTTNADSLIYVYRNGVEQKIPVKAITSAKKRKFSLLKTTGCFLLGLIGFTAFLVYGAENSATE